MSIYVGSTVQLSATFKNFAGAVADPSTIKVIYKNPSGETAESSFASSGSGGWTKTSTGVYTFDLEVTEAGKWTYAFEGSGAVDVYSSSVFRVLARPAG